MLTLTGNLEAFLTLRSMPSTEEMLDKYLLMISRKRPGEEVEEKSRELGSGCLPLYQEAVRSEAQPHSLMGLCNSFCKMRIMGLLGEIK